jgi:hypothetical protein
MMNNYDFNIINSGLFDRVVFLLERERERERVLNTIIHPSPSIIF